MADKSFKEDKAKEPKKPVVVDPAQAELDRIAADDVFVPQSLLRIAEGIAREDVARAAAAELAAEAVAADAEGAPTTDKSVAERRWDKAMTEAKATVAAEAKDKK